MPETDNQSAGFPKQPAADFDVQKSFCTECGKPIEYHNSLHLPRGGGVCFECGSDYAECEECRSHFLPQEEELICSFCIKVIFLEKQMTEFEKLLL